jgi:hypothetical protein
MVLDATFAAAESKSRRRDVGMPNRTMRIGMQCPLLVVLQQIGSISFHRPIIGAKG